MRSIEERDRIVGMLAAPPHAAVYPDMRLSRGELVEVWYAVWYDHVGRVIKKRLARATDKATAQRDAWAQAQGMVDDRELNLFKRDCMTRHELVEVAERALFPRVVVARQVERICTVLHRESAESPEPHGRRPGVEMFAMRTQINPREIYRILDDIDRITISRSLTDRICAEFDIGTHDLIDQSLDWAEARGAWLGRPGELDSWPVGYEDVKVVAPRSLDGDQILDLQEML